MVKHSKHSDQNDHSMMTSFTSMRTLEYVSVSRWRKKMCFWQRRPTLCGILIIRKIGTKKMLHRNAFWELKGRIGLSLFRLGARSFFPRAYCSLIFSKLWWKICTPGNISELFYFVKDPFQQSLRLWGKIHIIFSCPQVIRNWDFRQYSRNNWKWLFIKCWIICFLFWQAFVSTANLLLTLSSLF